MTKIEGHLSQGNLPAASNEARSFVLLVRLLLLWEIVPRSHIPLSTEDRAEAANSEHNEVPVEDVDIVPLRRLTEVATVRP